MELKRSKLIADTTVGLVQMSNIDICFTINPFQLLILAIKLSTHFSSNTLQVTENI